MTSPTRRRGKGVSLPSHKGTTTKQGPATHEREQEEEEIDPRAPEVEIKVVQAVREYLTHNRFTATLRSLEKEFNGKYAPYARGDVDPLKEVEMNYLNSMDSEGIKDMFLASFDAANVHNLNRYWEKFIPDNIRDHNLESEKLEFYVNIHCAIHPFRLTSLKQHKGDPIAAAQAAVTSVQSFSHFLNSRGQTLSQNPEFLPFFALPYIPSPIDHPSFKALFDDNWVTILRDKLTTFLLHALREYEPTGPVLYKAILGHGNNLRRSNMDLVASGSGRVGADIIRSSKDPNFIREENMEEVLSSTGDSEYQLMRVAFVNREKKLRDFGYSIYSLCIELLQELVRLSRHPEVNTELLPYSYQKLEAFANVLSSKVGTPIPPEVLRVTYYAASNHASSIGRPVNSNAISYRSPKQATTKHYSRKPPTVKLTTLNLDSIKGTLRSCFIKDPDTDEKHTIYYVALVLQALRWRLTKYTARVRNNTLRQFTAGDIFDIKNEEEGSVITRILNQTDEDIWHQLQEYILRLVNVMASHAIGREYLLEDKSIIEKLILLLKGEGKHVPTRQNALGILQKLSLRRKPQISMIRLGIIEWIVDTLRSNHVTDESHHSLSDYMIEYATALLMNLCLRTAGKIKTESKDMDILAVLSSLIEHDNTQVRTYVNGTLYSILSRPVLKERAMELGLDEALRRVGKVCDEQFQKQIDYILKQLLDNNCENQTARESDDEAEEEDDINDVAQDSQEPPEDEYTEESVVVTEGELQGEELLASNYKAVGSDGHQLLEEQSPNSPNGEGKSFGVPVEMQSRDKIPRTPTNGGSFLEHSSFLLNDQGDEAFIASYMDGQSYNGNSPSRSHRNTTDTMTAKLAAIEGNLIVPPGETKEEYLKGFISKRELMRTPAGSLGVEEEELVNTAPVSVLPAINRVKATAQRSKLRSPKIKAGKQKKK